MLDGVENNLAMRDIEVSPDGTRQVLGAGKYLGTPRHRCYRVVSAAVQAETLNRHGCERCGSPDKSDAHHHDYARPLDVIWLCRPCHSRETRAGDRGYTLVPFAEPVVQRLDDPRERLDARVLVSELLGMADLNRRETLALKAKCVHGASLMQIGRVLGCTRERARQIYERAIDKVRSVPWVIPQSRAEQSRDVAAAEPLIAKARRESATQRINNYYAAARAPRAALTTGGILRAELAAAKARLQGRAA